MLVTIERKARIYIKFSQLTPVLLFIKSGLSKNQLLRKDKLNLDNASYFLNSFYKFTFTAINRLIYCVIINKGSFYNKMLYNPHFKIMFVLFSICYLRRILPTIHVTILGRFVTSLAYIFYFFSTLILILNKCYGVLS